MTLTDFLLARIAEDAAAANSAHRESMRGHAGPGFARSLLAWQDQAKDVRGRDLIGRMTPARVLADCEAKRRIVEDLTRTEAQGFTNDFSDGAAFSLRRAVALLALPYASHPDYREEWKP